MKCAICDHERDEKYRPFCSKRCADVDLARWLDGSYSIPDEGADTHDAPPPVPIFRGDDV